MVGFDDAFRAEVAEVVHGALTQLGQGVEGVSLPSLAEVRGLLSIPPNFEMGQAALPCFPFAKALKQPPPKVAETLSSQINNGPLRFIERAVVAGGYLNFFCNFSAYGEHFTRIVADGEMFERGVLGKEQREKIVVEYSQPNTHKALHVGHLRCLFLGDAVSRILAYAGHEVVKVTYPGDMGTHVAKVLWYIRNKWEGALPTENRADWLGDMYVRAKLAFEEVEGTPAEAEVRAELSRAFSSVEKCSGAYFELWKETREWSLEEMRQVYTLFGVTFDAWYTESECDVPATEFVRKKYDEGFFVKDQGAVGKDLSDWKLGFAIVLKSDGHGLYLTKDLELLRRKFEDPKVARSIYVVDARQKLHFQQLFKIAELMGYPQAKKSLHLSYETVNTPDGKAFASRSFSGVGLTDVRLAMEQKVTTDYLARYRGEWSDQEIENTARMVMAGALKYGMLKVDNNTQVTFVLDEWLKLDGDTGPYLQYVHARCKNIIEKQGEPRREGTFTLVERQERELLFQLGRFHEFVAQAAEQYRPSILAGFLLDLARSYNRFYEACPIRSAEGDLRNSRLWVVDATARVIAKGLELLGISAPRRM